MDGIGQQRYGPVVFVAPGQVHREKLQGLGMEGVDGEREKMDHPHYEKGSGRWGRDAFQEATKIFQDQFVKLDTRKEITPKIAPAKH